MNLLTGIDDPEATCRLITERLGAHSTWFCVAEESPAAIELRRDEWDLRVSNGQIIFSYWGTAGARSWRVTAWEWTGAKLLMKVARRMGAARATLELVPRASLSETAAIVDAARRAACARLAALARAIWPGAKIGRAGFSSAPRGGPGRYARILLCSRGQRIAVTGPVARDYACETEALLSSALVWFARLGESENAPQRLWIIMPHKYAQALAEMLALLHHDLRRAIEIYEMDEDEKAIAPVPACDLNQLFADPPRLRRPSRATAMSDWAARITDLAPSAIDVVRARHGETLRYHGLAFARVRRVAGSARAWFGIEGTRRRPLDDASWPELLKLVGELAAHRTDSASNRCHAFYTAAPEAWLESLLRRDITRLDPGLILSPLHTQFRAAHGGGRSARPVDLLALRQDGRLALIELKVAEDRELVLQGADYWRRVEAYRRCGALQGARLFGDKTMADQPALVYLVAPALRFHRAFRTLARSITPEIEIYRFDINEDWRAGVRVLRRERVNC